MIHRDERTAELGSRARSEDTTTCLPRALRAARPAGYAAFGSVARHEARPGSDIDLLVRSPEGASSFDFIRFKQLLERVLGREIDLVDVGGLQPGLDDDIRREAVAL